MTTKSDDASPHVEAVHDASQPKSIDNVKAMAADGAAQMRSELDDLPILKALWLYKRIAVLCMMAAFSAALEGYRACCPFSECLPDEY